jgi:hypothetical protein
VLNGILAGILLRCNKFGRTKTVAPMDIRLVFFHFNELQVSAALCGGAG